MKPTTSANLDRFLSKYRNDGVFFLAPGHVEGGEAVPSFDLGLTIVCSKLNIRPAWEIAEHDLDAVGIHEGDDVVVPDGVKEPQVLGTLERIKKMRKGDTQEPPNTPVGSQPRVGRNEACPCGSGKKFKKCHGQ
jgi:hypothetical protein